MKYFLRADVIPCKGFTRTALIDIVNSEVSFLDNSHYDTVHQLYNMGVELMDENLLSLLQADNYVIKAENIDHFPRISLKKTESVFSIDNCIIDYNNHSTYNVVHILQQLDDLNCKYVQLRYFDYSDEIYKVVDYLNETKSFIQNIEIIIKKTHNHFQKLEKLFHENLRINKLILFKSENTGVLSLSQGRIFIEVQDDIADCKSCGIISTNGFFINKYHVKEANNFNTCLAKKISIDVTGNIKNCPSMPESFGCIEDTTLKQALGKASFKKYWNLTKDQVAICKDCEFRYICTDCRAYTERSHFSDEGLDISKPLKCGYNPYSGEWEEWSQNPLKQGAIEYYGMQRLIKI